AFKAAASVAAGGDEAGCSAVNCAPQRGGRLAPSSSTAASHAARRQGSCCIKPVAFMAGQAQRRHSFAASIGRRQTRGRGGRANQYSNCAVGSRSIRGKSNGEVGKRRSEVGKARAEKRRPKAESRKRKAVRKWKAERKVERD